MGPVRVLVSSEVADEVGVRCLSAVAGVEVLLYDPQAPQVDARQRTGQVLVPPYHGSRRALPLVSQLPELRMVQLLSAGADRWVGHVPAEVVLATARGAHAGPVSEWVLSAVLALLRQWPTLVRYQDTATWAHDAVTADTLAGKRVLILGAGAIGRAVAAKLAAFDATANLVARRARGDVHGVDELPALLPTHEILVITAPLTSETRGLVDADVLARLPDGALLVNAGRGPIVDTGALLAQTQTGRLRAALDVTEPEPLPAEHSLWHCPGVLISPHVARTVPGTARLCYHVAADQITTYLRGETPANAATERDSPSGT